MELIENDVKTGATVYLDGKQFVGCRYEHCLLVYEGGECEFHAQLNNCRFDFRGAAFNTIRLLQQLRILPEDPGTLLAIPSKPIAH
jgi:hypothetical protein